MASITSTDTALVAGRADTGPEWARRYPPLLAIAVALLISLAVLPSALNLPQSNPSQTLEYAPVPPDDETPPDAPPGNANEFGLGGSSTLEGSFEELEEELAELPDEPPPPPNDPLASARSPRTKRCVGTPPRQTEDPNSPPCVANFEGDNFGSTYTGVTRDEVRILLYLQGNIRYIDQCRDPNQVTPDHEYFDLLEPPKPDEHCMVRVSRTWQAYFNERYQTYGRFAHFYVYFSARGNSSEARQSDAADNFSQVKPFAVISTAISHDIDYMEAMARKGVLVFGSQLGRPAELFRKHKPKVWGYPPALEIQAEMFSSYLCAKVAPYPTSFPGPSVPIIDRGVKRRYGLWYTEDKGHPELVQLAELVKELVGRCGIEFAAINRFPSAGFRQDNRYTPEYARRAVADFKENEVTTIIWPAGLETNLTKQMAAGNYRPELFILGDRLIETDEAAAFQDQSGFANARMVTYITHSARLEDEHCYIAYKSSDPDGNRKEIDVDACELYEDLRQVFIGIQVAGPRLGPTNIDKGFHAIPKRPSGDPQVPACYYEPGDYTCVKDALVERWDVQGDDGSGCFRATEAGKRYERGKWPPGESLAQDKPTDPCNIYTDHALTDPNGPNALEEIED